MSVLRGRIWPDGTWGVGFERKLKPAPLRFSPLTHTGSEFVLKAIAVHGILAALAFVSGPDEWYDPLTFSLQLVPESEQAERPSITLSESSKSDARSKRGFRGITPLGRKMVRSAGTILERDYGRECLTFATLTIPYRGDDSWKGIMENWGRIVELLLRYVRNCLKESGLSANILYCTELQESRLERYGEPGYHLHLVWPNLKPGLWSVDVSDLKKRWAGILANYASSSEVPGVRLPRVETAVVKKTVAGYLSKYLSKGASSGALRALESRGILPPASWWGMSSVLRRAVKAGIVILRDRPARFLMKMIDRGEWDGAVYAHSKEYDGHDVVLGFYGYLKGWNDEHCLHDIANVDRDSFVNMLVN